MPASNLCFSQQRYPRIPLGEASLSVTKWNRNYSRTGHGTREERVRNGFGRSTHRGRIRRGSKKTYHWLINHDELRTCPRLASLLLTTITRLCPSTKAAPRPLPAPREASHSQRNAQASCSRSTGNFPAKKCVGKDWDNGSVPVSPGQSLEESAATLAVGRRYVTLRFSSIIPRE